MQAICQLFQLALRLRCRSVLTFLRLLLSGRFAEIRETLSKKIEPTATASASPAPRAGSRVDLAVAGINGEPAHYYGALQTLRQNTQPGEIAEFASKIDFRIFDYLKPKEYHDFSPSERESFVEVSDLICQVPASAIALIRAVDYVLNAKIAGAFVECGVFKGASPIIIAKTLLRHGIGNRDIYLYDTFEGMPKPTDWDVDYTGARSMDVWEKTKWQHVDGSSDVYSPIEEVRENLRRVAYPTERFHLVKGKVEDTIPSTIPVRIALLRLDTDYYESTKHELEHLFPRLEKGGVLIIDDYGHFQGARKATDEFFKTHGIPMYLTRVSESVRFGVKAF